MGARAEALARRIEQGAKTLEAFAQGLSETEWKTPIPPDGRTAGVIVHHVASLYPIEVHLANEIAAGRAVTDVTWAVVADMNAQHALDNAGCGKQETLELLRRNSVEAAQAIRGLSDDQLDSAAAFSLNAGAPMTSQFVIEDHALRHAWHHLAKIKAVLERVAV